jgi:predicted RND superfamily exporter protein
VGFIALLGWKLDLAFTSAPTLLTAIGVAHSVHILSEFRARFAALGDRRDALVATFALIGTPCMLTSVTTAVGFLAMSFVPIKGIAHMAVYNAFGVLAAFLLSFTLLVAFLSFGRRAPRRIAPGDTMPPIHGRWMRAGLLGVARFVMRRRVPILVAFGAVFALSIAGIARLTVDSNWLEDFSDDMPIKAVTQRVDAVMGGVTNLILLFDGGAPDAVKEPAVLRDIERVQRWADARPHLVRKSYSLVDILKDLNQSFHAEDPAWFRLPESRDLVAQYLLLYETAGGGESDEYVSSDYRRSSLELRLRLAMTGETAALVRDLEAELAARPLEASTLSLTGIGALWLKLLDYIVGSQIQAFLVAFSAIAVLMCLLFWSVRTGAISMMPNLSPVLLILGVMGWLGIPLDYNKVSIAAVAMGIAVDDTIHLVSRYRHEFQRLGRYDEALLAAMLGVGRALIVTSVALVLGFLVLVLSLLDSQATFGILLAATITTALVADFLLMPALVLTVHPFGPEGAGTQASPAIRAAA